MLAREFSFFVETRKGDGHHHPAEPTVFTHAPEAADKLSPLLRSSERDERHRAVWPDGVAGVGPCARHGYGAARAVGSMLAKSDGTLPWWRVIAANGRLVPGLEADHTRRLRAEGVDIADGRVRMR